jgi:hypothetical protein
MQESMYSSSNTNKKKEEEGKQNTEYENTQTGIHKLKLDIEKLYLLGYSAV